MRTHEMLILYKYSDNFCWFEWFFSAIYIIRKGIKIIPLKPDVREDCGMLLFKLLLLLLLLIGKLYEPPLLLRTWD